MDAARRRFTPEFINRIDKMVVFHALGEAELRQIVDLELSIGGGSPHHAATGAGGIALAVADHGQGLPAARRNRRALWRAPSETRD